MNTGVLPFVRTIDFTRNDFHEDFPNLSHLTGLQNLKLDRTNLKEIPDVLGKLVKLENLSLKNNEIEKLYGEITELMTLRSLILRRNKIKTSGVPQELFNIAELTTLDLSHNSLKEVPNGLDKAKSLLVLNLSHNQICTIPGHLFVGCSDLLYLDLSNNFLDTLPPQTRRLTNLETLILNHNPLEMFQLRQLPSLQNLKYLHMRDTQRNLLNFPTALDLVINLVELDISQNNLSKIPDTCYSLINLKRLNLSDNEITEISPNIEQLQKLEVLNLSRNQLTALHPNICKLIRLRHLHVNENKLNFESIPAGIGKLGALEIFSASYNDIEMIPEGLCRCGKLKKLNLSNNKLITLPESIHLAEFEVLDVKNNPDLVMPPKPQTDAVKGSGIEFYNIDFSLQSQLRRAGAAVPAQIADSPSSTNLKEAALARKLRLRRARNQDSNGDKDSAKILKGMQDIANEKNANSAEDDAMMQSLQPKKWEDSLEKPPLDYSEFFEEEDGQTVGLTIWEIENFLPNKIEEVALHGKFYEADCYIVLKTFMNENQLSWEIYFWIGSHATLDKKACAAIHAVNLRNYLGARCRTIREEQADESDEFLALFDNEIVYIEGGRTSCGFFTIEETVHTTRLYLIRSDEKSIIVEPVEMHHSSLNANDVFILDNGAKIFLWFGKKSRNTVKSKARLLATKVNKNDKKNKGEIFTETQGNESEDFLTLIGLNPDEEYSFASEETDRPKRGPRLYTVQLGLGYLEMPQVEIPQQKLVHTILNSKSVYIMDCHADLFIWFGKKSTRLVRAAAIKLSQELFAMINRPHYSMITKIQEGSENHIFRSFFAGWDEVIAVDFTRTAQSVARTGANLTQWAKQQEAKSDLSALFMQRAPPMTAEEAQQLIEDWNYDLDAMEVFVLDGKKFVRLPEEEVGVFYSADCYVFLCRYCIPVDDECEEEGKNAPPPEDEIQCVVYFWQGRDSSNMGWLTFTFTLQKKFKAMFGESLEVVKVMQQQENLKFLSHFRGKFIIKTGKRNDALSANKKNAVEFFHLRSNGGPICTRLLQIKPDAGQLNSAFSYILNVPFETDSGGQSGIIYVWIGSKCKTEESILIQEIAESLFNSPWVSMQVINEGEEPQNFFWYGLNGEKPYEKDAEFMNYARLFRCSNEKGYFTVAEKCSDFCQDDLADEDIMILDNGEQVFLWLGSRCSEVEIKLAYKSAQVYIQHMRIKQPERPRKLFLTLKNKESKRFTKCFHGWTHFRPLS